MVADHAWHPDLTKHVGHAEQSSGDDLVQFKRLANCWRPIRLDKLVMDQDN